MFESSGEQLNLHERTQVLCFLLRDMRLFTVVGHVAMILSFESAHSRATNPAHHTCQC